MPGMSKLTKPAKQLAIAACRSAGPWLPSEFLRVNFRKHVATRLMDPRALPRGLRPLHTRECTAAILADPYIYTHHTIFWFRRLYEPHTVAFLKRWLSPGDVAIDIGMNLGHFSTLAAEIVGKGGKVVAFEPNPNLCQQVGEHLRSQGLHQVEIRNMAIGPAEGVVRLSVPDDTGSSFVSDITDRKPDETMKSFEVAMRIGDQELAQVHGDRLVVKIDVEGAELEVLSGMKQALASRVAAGQIEISPHWLGPEKLKAIQTLLEQSGFHMYHATTRPELRPVRISDLTTQEDVWFIRDTGRPRE